MTVPQSPARVVTCILESEGKILILRRSEKVGTYQGRWAGVAGFIESDPDTQALTEIREETTLQPPDVVLVRKNEPIPIEDKALGRKWVIYPYLFHVNRPGKITLDWEHTDMKWIDPREIDGFVTVPGLKNVIEAVYHEAVT